MAPEHKHTSNETDLARMDDEGGWHDARFVQDKESVRRPKRRQGEDREPPLTGGYGYGFGYGYDRDNMTGGEYGGYGESGSAPMRRTGRKRARDRDGVRRSRAKRDRES